MLHARTLNSLESFLATGSTIAFFFFFFLDDAFATVFGLSDSPFASIFMDSGDALFALAGLFAGLCLVGGSTVGATPPLTGDFARALDSLDGTTSVVVSWGTTCCTFVATWFALVGSFATVVVFGDTCAALA